jgi:D-alanyl-D-alanine carboxypeptidase
MHRFFYSILTAVIVGGILALASIFIMKKASEPRVISAMKTKDIVHNEGEEDPTFISSFSRGFQYSAGTSTQSDESIYATSFSKITAKAYMVTSIDRHNILLEKDADRLYPIASITKLITAVIAKKVFDEDDLITINFRILSAEGDTGKLRLGEKIKVKEILYPLLMVSSNDAAEGLAQTYDAIHGRGKFVKEMNSWASSVGAYRTYLKDASGLSSANVSTAHDLSIITQWIDKNEPDIFDITLNKNKTIRSHSWISPTHFLNLSSSQGGKNGYTVEANRTNVSLFSVGFPKRLYSVVLLGSEQRDSDTLAVLNEALK